MLAPDLPQAFFDSERHSEIPYGITYLSVQIYYDKQSFIQRKPVQSDVFEPEVRMSVLNMPHYYTMHTTELGRGELRC